MFPRIFLLMLMRYIDVLTALLRTVDTGKRLDNVNRTHLVLASVKLVLQKSTRPTCDLLDSNYFLSQQQHLRKLSYSAAPVALFVRMMSS